MNTKLIAAAAAAGVVAGALLLLMSAQPQEPIPLEVHEANAKVFASEFWDQGAESLSCGPAKSIWGKYALCIIHSFPEDNSAKVDRVVLTCWEECRVQWSK